ncbi:MAG: hypothetical protein DME33_07980 [Verrucomicrobia bacterium]|nr:MAG: hypothetical protein DME33_07980 [Verrucomicrobiota bacterium]
MSAPKIVGRRKTPRTPAEFHALGAQLDLEAKTLDPHRPRGFVVKFRTWNDLERWESSRRIQQANRARRGMTD